MRKELTIMIPLLKGRLHIAYPMIAFMQHPNAKDFLYNSFINFECFKDRKDLNLCFTTTLENEKCYGLHHLNIHKEYNDFTVEKNMDLVEALIDEIDKENYIYIFFDDYYLPNKYDIHDVHINMIYGYDSNEKVFMSVGYDDRHRYRRLTIPFEIATQAFSYKKVEVYKTDYTKRYDFDPTFFVLQVQDFLFGGNSFLEKGEEVVCGFTKEDFLYGIDVYERIFQHYVEYIAGEKMDFRIIHQIYEISMLNEKRVLYLQNKLNDNISNELVNGSREIYLLAKKMRNLTLKSIVGNERELAYEIIEKLKMHKEKTKTLYEQLLNIFD